MLISLCEEDAVRIWRLASKATYEIDAPAESEQRESLRRIMVTIGKELGINLRVAVAHQERKDAAELTKE